MIFSTEGRLQEPAAWLKMSPTKFSELVFDAVLFTTSIDAYATYNTNITLTLINIQKSLLVTLLLLFYLFFYLLLLLFSQSCIGYNYLNYR